VEQAAYAAPRETVKKEHRVLLCPLPLRVDNRGREVYRGLEEMMQERRVALRNIPDEPVCRQLMDAHAMLPNIVEHSYRVCQVANFIGKALSRSEDGLNPLLIEAAALLHDITKTQSLKTKENHAETGANLLEEMGYPQVAEVVRGHVRLAAGTGLSPIREVHIINYADKRVRHATVVSLEERFVDLVERYGQTEERRLRIEKMRRTTLELEPLLFRRMDMNPRVLEAFNELSPFDLKTVPPQLSLDLPHLSC